MGTAQENFEFISRENDTTLRIVNGHDLSYFQQCCAGILERMTFVSDAIGILLQPMESNKGLEFSVGILLRSVLLDGLVALNLLHEFNESFKSKKTQLEIFNGLNDVGQAILSDGLMQAIKYLQGSKKFGYYESDEEMNRAVNNFIKKYQEFFEQSDDPTQKPVLKKQPDSGFQLFDNLSESDFENLRRAYDKYQLYSK